MNFYTIKNRKELTLEISTVDISVDFFGMLFSGVDHT